MESGYAEAFFAKGSCGFPDWTPKLVPLRKEADKQQGWLQTLLLQVLTTQQRQWEAQEYLHASVSSRAAAVPIQDAASVGSIEAMENKRGNPAPGPAAGPSKCYACGQHGHWKRVCPNWDVGTEASPRDWEGAGAQESSL
ncbi:hypothetical protein UY3_11432 [Chelonia mydas]|uniref:CCHC-type domain-containing protein n=1 Tax=Chelonia mydas TaxID=8469 RepID=M7BHE4_CHEMY|nr:hypothetical protein UY3_11432 [Chelonia mydas]